MNNLPWLIPILMNQQNKTQINSIEELILFVIFTAIISVIAGIIFVIAIKIIDKWF